MSAASAEPGLPRGPVWLGHPLARAGLAIVAIGLAGVVLHRLTGQVRLADMRADLAAARPEAVLRAAIWTLASFVALGSYDLLALRAVAPGKVPAGAAVLTGAAGFALSNCLGFSYVIGPALRYRVYARHGLDLERSAAVLGYAFAAFWSAIVTLLGLLFLSRSGALAGILPLPGGVEVGLGLLCLAVVGGALPCWLLVRAGSRGLA